MLPSACPPTLPLRAPALLVPARSKQNFMIDCSFLFFQIFFCQSNTPSLLKPTNQTEGKLKMQELKKNRKKDKSSQPELDVASASVSPPPSPSPFSSPPLVPGDLSAPPPFLSPAVPLSPCPFPSHGCVSVSQTSPLLALAPSPAPAPAPAPALAFSLACIR